MSPALIDEIDVVAAEAEHHVGAAGAVQHVDAGIAAELLASPLPVKLIALVRPWSATERISTSLPAARM